MLRGLACEHATVHYKNCLMLKIKFSFVMLCTLFMMSFILASIMEHQNEIGFYWKACIVIGEIFLLKCKFLGLLIPCCIGVV